MVPKRWNLVIAFSSFILMTITFGITGSTGIYNIKFMEHFGVGTVDVSLIGSINMAMYMGSGISGVPFRSSILSEQIYSIGPVVSLLLQRLSFRQVSVIGSLLSTGSLLCIPFLKDIVYLYIVYGFMQGFGMAMAFIPSNIVVGLCFDEHRSLATGIVMGGVGLGGVVFPLLIHAQIHYYGWQGSFFILAGVMVQCVIFSALLFPLNKIEGQQNSEMTEMTGLDYLQKLSEAPRRSTLISGSDVIISKLICKKMISNYEKNSDISIKCDTEMEVTIGEKNIKVSSIKCSISNEIIGNIYINRDEKTDDDVTDNENQTSDVCDETEITTLDEHTETKCTTIEHEKGTNFVSVTKRTSKKLDIEFKTKTKDKKSSMKDVIRKHFSFLCNFSFIVFNVNNILWNMSVAICWIISPEYVVYIGLTDADAALILTFGGVGIIAGCVVGGALGNIRCLSRLYVYILWHFVMGVSISGMTMKIFFNVTTMSCIMFVNGVAFGGILALLITLTVDILGHKYLTEAYGYLMLSNGVGALIGPPLGGALKDAFGDYKPTFYFSSGVLLLGGLLVFLIKVERFVRINRKNSIPETCIEMKQK